MTLTERLNYFGRTAVFKWKNLCPQCWYINLFTDIRAKDSCHRCKFRRDE